jgi:hypothetical protein
MAESYCDNPILSTPGQWQAGGGGKRSDPHW